MNFSHLHHRVCRQQHRRCGILKFELRLLFDFSMKFVFFFSQRHRDQIENKSSRFHLFRPYRIILRLQSFFIHFVNLKKDNGERSQIDIYRRMTNAKIKMNRKNPHRMKIFPKQIKHDHSTVKNHAKPIHSNKYQINI